MAPSTTAPAVHQGYRNPSINVEDLNGYTPGGYCPVKIDDEFDTDDAKYTVLHKLGFGPSSTVWLVRRDIKEPNDPRFHSKEPKKPSFHALKILRADLSTAQHTEFEMIRRLGRTDLGFEGHRHSSLVEIQAFFRRSSANGVHFCFVLPLLGPSLFDLRVTSELDNDRRRRICEQLANALDCLHGFNICHSHLSESHVLVEIPDRHLLDERRILDHVGRPTTEPVVLANGSHPPPNPQCPDIVIQPASFSGFPFHSAASITLVGFGNAFDEFGPSPTRSPHCPSPLFPPELLFGHSYTRRSDVWQLACLLFKLHTGHYPFEGGRCYEVFVGHIARYLGPIPESWRGKDDWDRYKTLITPPGQAEGEGWEEWCDERQPTRSIHRDLAAFADLTEEACKGLAMLLEKMLVWEPEGRPTMGPVYEEALRLWGETSEEREKREKEERERKEREESENLNRIRDEREREMLRKLTEEGFDSGSGGTRKGATRKGATRKGATRKGATFFGVKTKLHLH